VIPAMAWVQDDSRTVPPARTVRSSGSGADPTEITPDGTANGKYLVSSEGIASHRPFVRIAYESP